MTTTNEFRGLGRSAALLIAMNLGCAGSHAAARHAEATATVAVQADEPVEDCEAAAKAPKPAIEMCTE